MSRFLGAVALALVMAFVAAVPRIGTVATWKVVLGLIGIVIFVAAGRGGGEAARR